MNVKQYLSRPAKTGGAEKAAGRLSEYDFCKGLLMIGVVLGHSITALKAGSNCDVWIHVFIRTYDMPFFAFISGVFLRKSCEKHNTFENVFNKVTSILFPVLLWNLIFDPITGYFSVTRFWFLWSIFFCSVGIIIVHGITKKCAFLRLPLFICALIATHIGIPEKLRLGSFHIGFLLFPCIVGYYYDRISAFVRKTGHARAIKTLCVVSFCLLLCFWNTNWNVWTTDCNVLAHGTPLVSSLKMLYRASIGITGSLSMKLLFDFVYGKLKESKNPWDERLSDFTVKVGRHTLEIYILQSLIVERWGAAAVRKVVSLLNYNPFVFDPDFLGWFIAPAVAVVSVAVCWLIQEGLGKIPFVGDFIFGGTAASWKKRFKK